MRLPLDGLGVRLPKSDDADGVHGAKELPRVFVDSYGDDIRTKEGYFGDLASKGAFRKLIADLRAALAQGAGDPIADEPETLARSRIDKILKEGDSSQAGVILSVVEKFASNIAQVVAHLYKLRHWRKVERILVGGGFRGSRVGEFAIGRAQVLVREQVDEHVEVQPIRHDPDEAGILGAAQLFAPKLLKGVEHIVGVDIGGSNFRCGLIALHQDQDKALRKAEIVAHQIWQHAEVEDKTLDGSMEKLAAMLRASLKYAEEKKLKVAPLVGVGVPGTVMEDGGLEGGVLNLPGDWKSPAFNLPSRLRQMIPEIEGQPTQVVMHNDAVVQGLSQVPFQTDVERFGVLTIGTGLGNAVYRNKEFKGK
jgi:predicted NBD/HSP70 family sugar kinase